NYLGYRDDYVPTWRFQFLLERARYFTEHAKEAQREYLNFLANAEREEFQELTVAQAVVLEKSNTRIETARVEQARLEVEVSKWSEELALLSARHAQSRLDNFETFDERAEKLEDEVLDGTILSAIGTGASTAVTNAATGAAIGGAI